MRGAGVRWLVVRGLWVGMALAVFFAVCLLPAAQAQNRGAGRLGAASGKVTMYGLTLGDRLVLPRCESSDVGVLKRYMGPTCYAPKEGTLDMVWIAFSRNASPQGSVDNVIGGMLVDDRLIGLLVFAAGGEQGSEAVVKLLYEKFGEPDDLGIAAQAHSANAVLALPDSFFVMWHADNVEVFYAEQAAGLGKGIGLISLVLREGGSAGAQGGQTPM